MLTAVLLFSETTVEKLAGHVITPEEVRQVNAHRDPQPEAARGRFCADGRPDTRRQV